MVVLGGDPVNPGAPPPKKKTDARSIDVDKQRPVWRTQKPDLNSFSFQQYKQHLHNYQYCSLRIRSITTLRRSPKPYSDYEGPRIRANLHPKPRTPSLKPPPLVTAGIRSKPRAWGEGFRSQGPLCSWILFGIWVGLSRFRVGGLGV